MPRPPLTEEEVANLDNPSDDDYDDRPPRASRKSTTQSRARKGPAKPRKRTRTSDHDSDDFLSAVSESEVEPEDDPNVERNARGTARRSTTKRARYEEPPSEDEEEEQDEQGESEDELGEAEAPAEKPRKRVVLKFSQKPTDRQVTASATRSTRARSRSNSIKDSDMTHVTQFGNRRNTRSRHGDEENMIALTNSGHHAEVVRQGTHSPEVENQPRTRRTASAAKTTTTIVEEEQEEDEEEETKPKKKDLLEGGAAQVEVMESDPQAEPDEEAPAVAAEDAADSNNNPADVEMGEDGFVPESQQDQEDEDEEAPRSGSRRARSSAKELVVSDVVQQQEEGEEEPTPLRRSSRKTASKNSSQKKHDEGSDFEPNDEEANDDDISDSEASQQQQQSPQKGSQNSDEADEGSAAGRRPGLRKRQSRSRGESEAAGELHDEVAELRPSRRRRERPQIAYEDKPRRTRKTVDYRVYKPEMGLRVEETENEVAASPSRRARNGGGGSYQRGLFSTSGPFGGAGGPPPLLGPGGPAGMGATGGVESDSSDDETGQRPRVGGAAGMTPTSALPPGLNLGGGGAPPQQTHGGPDAAGGAPGTAGTPANLGKVKDKQAMADSDPLGVDPNVNFDSVGGMQGHIDQLKEMVSLPLLYPEVFQRFHIVPPRGVLFHGPPGTGKTLLARALATSVSSHGRKVTFYMRKGADALSKWVGEAERQLRLLFDEARKNQPSIIFFDEIDGLAPVRSSKQEQIHSSIVSTLLALMDGMDGRGQVIVIGATNRPDSVDPALRRPGRFDREFYFPLPSTDARRAILDIHTKGWDPPLPSEIKDELSELTKGYGGADLRALCTEAALNAVQRKYPQIYRSNEKLLIDPKKIDVNPKDFMISIKKLIPSSERAASSGASPLPATVEPLLRGTLRAIEEVIREIIPLKQKTTALEEAQFEEPQDQNGFKREKMQSAFETSRVFRPRLLIRGDHGMGQQYLAGALLNHFEGLHLQPFDLPTLLSDSTRSPEATVVQLFTEVKRHKPSVIYIPDVNTWYDTVGHTVVSTFLGLLRSLPPTDPVLLLGVSEGEVEDGNPEMVKALFGYSKKNTFALQPPGSDMRREFFQPLVDYIKTAPSDFPDPANRKKRKLETLPPAPAPESAASRQPGSLSKDELKSQKKKDRQTLNLLKIRIQPIMNEIKKYKRFRAGVIDDSQIRYLFDEENPNVVTSDLPIEQRIAFRPFEKDTDKFGVPGLREVASDKFFYNMEIVTIEKRLSNGYYKRPKEFLADIKRIAKDARKFGEQDRLIKANELLSNVEVDIGLIEQADTAFVSECENVYMRELERERLALEKAKRNAAARGEELGATGPTSATNVAHGTAEESNQSTGPVMLGEHASHAQPQPVTPNRPTHSNSLTNGINAHDHDEPNPGQQPNVSGSGGSVSHDKSGGTDHDGDVQMSNSENTSGATGGQDNNTQNSSFGPSAQPRPAHSYTAPSQQMRQQSGLSNFSQKGTMTPMAPGSQPQDYTNDASTTQTTSDKKHSGPTEHSNNSISARHEGPDLTLYPDRISGDENLPDTQQGSSWGSQHTPLMTGIVEYANSQPGSGSAGAGAGAVNGKASQPRSQPEEQQQQQHTRPPVPPFNTSPELQAAAPQRSQHIHDVLNNENEHENDATAAHHQSHPELILDDAYIDKLHTELSSRTSGCSVEQLEQINTNLMDCIWKTRGDWNRVNVVAALQETFNDVLADMQTLQEFGPPSQKTKTDFARSRV